MNVLSWFMGLFAHVFVAIGFVLGSAAFVLKYFGFRIVALVALAVIAFVSWLSIGTPGAEFTEGSAWHVFVMLAFIMGIGYLAGRESRP